MWLRKKTLPVAGCIGAFGLNQGFCKVTQSSSKLHLSSASLAEVKTECSVGVRPIQGDVDLLICNTSL